MLKTIYIETLTIKFVLLFELNGAMLIDIILYHRINNFLVYMYAFY